VALDSQTKRRSVLATGLAFLVIAPLTDGTTSAVDREHITGLYAGINPTTHVATADLHIFSTSLVEPNHVADSGDNVLFKGQIEVQGGAYIGGIANYTAFSATGSITQAGIATASLGVTSAGTAVLFGAADGNIRLGNASTLADLTTGDYNIAIGDNALQYNETGEYNIAIGRYAMAGANATPFDVDNNIAVGSYSLFNIEHGSDKNTCLGFGSGYGITTGSNNILLGWNAGYRQTTNNNLLILDNQVRASIAEEGTNSIIYGVMAATPASQILNLNAVVNISQDLTVDGGTSLGDNAADTHNLFGVSTLGDGGTTNYLGVSATGVQSFVGLARIDWTKKTANGVAIRNAHGTPTGAVADLQTAHDGNFYIVNEESGETPGLDIEVDFTGVTAFNWVQVLARYELASAAHGITVMLEITPFDGSAWHRYTFFKDQAADLTNESHSFFVPDDTPYINAGVVKVRFVHEMVGTSPAHLLVIDCVALY